MTPLPTTYKHFGNIFKQIYPKASFQHYKGCLGKVCVVGGSDVYTGAVYFSAISSLKLGGDLAYVICPSDASVVIKSYSPELMVLPYLNCDKHYPKVIELLDKCHSVVIGPGLGRDDVDKTLLHRIVSICLEKKKHLVLDADVLWILVNDPSLMKVLNGSTSTVHSNVVLTPNRMESLRLLEYFDLDRSDPGAIRKLANLTKCNVLMKGERDLFSNGNEIYDLTAVNERCPKRCGGQGDILAGCLSVCLLWAHNAGPPENSALNASIVATNLVKYSAGTIYKNLGISMTATDMISHIPHHIQQLFKNIS